jgi:hypothetical protein
MASGGRAGITMYWVVLQEQRKKRQMMINLNIGGEGKAKEERH